MLAVNQIDATALGCWAIWSAACASAAFAFLLAEVKGPGDGPAQDTDFGRRMQGQVFLSTHEAFADVAQRRKAG